MSLQESTTLSLTPKFEPERAMRLGVAAAAAPIWAAYYAAASTGVAFWWMTAWTRQAEQKSFTNNVLPLPVKKAVEIVEAPVEASVEAAAEIVEAAPAVIEAATPKPVAAPAAKPAAAKTASAKPSAPKTVSAKSAPAAKSVRPKA